MRKIIKIKDHWGQKVIYVEKCDNYKVENPDKPRKLCKQI